MKFYINHLKGKSTMLLFHGTGGNENDLLSIAHYIDKNANTVGFLGNEIEGGYRRFFNRFSVGNYDIPNLIKNTDELKGDIEILKNDPMLKSTMMVGVGFSNGANFLESLLQMYPKTLNKFILFSPVYVRKDLKFRNLKGLDILVVTSLIDPYSTEEDTMMLLNDLNEAGANVEVFLHESGHRITQEALNYAKDWYLKLK